MNTDDLREKIGVLTAKVDAAHDRIDKIQLLIREDLKEIKTDLKELNAYMHHRKGWNAAVILLSGFVGGTVFKILSLMFTK